MAEARKLRPISREEAGKWEIDFTTTGPLRVAKAEFDGNIDYHCRECGVVLVEQTNETGIATLMRLDCYNCGRSTSGTELGTTSAP